MDWYYALNGEQHGPVSDIQLEELIRAKTVALNTLVWNKELSDWHPLSVVRAAKTASGELPPILPLPTTRCVECGNIYEHTEMITLDKFWVCAACKPKFIQRMKEGGTVPGSSGILWRNKSNVLLRKDALFPDRCVRCNSSADGFKLKRDLSWHSPAYYILAISPLIYVIVAMIVRKKATLYIGLCETHRAERRRTIFIASMAAISGLVLLFLAAYVSNAWLALAGIFLLLGAGIYGAIKAAIISATKIDDNYIWFKGAGKPFLDTLQEWTGPK